MATTIPSFGTLVDATADGYKYDSSLRLFIRVRKVGAFYKIDLQPPTFKPNPTSHLLGVTSMSAQSDAWMTQEGIVDHIECIHKYMGRAKPLTIFVDEDGKELPEEKTITADVSVKVTPVVAISQTDSGEKQK